MATLRLTLYANDFSTLDSVDVPVTGRTYQGAGAAVKTARDHFWTNHVKDDLETLLASRKGLMDAASALIKLAVEPPHGFINQGVMNGLKAALQEAQMVDDLGLPKEILLALEKKFSG